MLNPDPLGRVGRGDRVMDSISGYRFGFRRAKPEAAIAKRAPPILLGVLFCRAAGTCLYSFSKRQIFTALFPCRTPLKSRWPTVTIAIAAGSVWLWVVAIRTLGKQFGTRRAGDGRSPTNHRRPVPESAQSDLSLNVRNAGRDGSGAQDAWWALLLAVLLSSSGANPNRNEEKVLRESFGAEFDAYNARSPQCSHEYSELRTALMPSAVVAEPV